LEQRPLERKLTFMPQPRGRFTRGRTPEPIKVVPHAHSDETGGGGRGARHVAPVLACPGSLAALGLLSPTPVQAADALPSWNDGPTKAAIVDFVTRVTTEGGPDFVPVDDRIATFDNEGTLWSEQPMYFQLAFAIDRVKTLAPQHPEWKTTQPFQAVLEGDMKALAAAGEKGLLELVMTTHAGMTTDEFEKIVTDWVATA